MLVFPKNAEKNASIIEKGQVHCAHYAVNKHWDKADLNLSMFSTLLIIMYKVLVSVTIEVMNF